MRFVSICEQWEGRTVDGKFPLLEWLGGSADRGVFLTVRQGIQTANIKLILVAESDADAYLAQWEAAKALSHPGLAQVMDTGRYVIDGKALVYVVTERAEGVLSGIIPKKALDPGRARSIFLPVMDALAYLHEKGLVHGRVRPSNILLVADQWKLSADSLVVAGEKPKLVQESDIYDAPEVAAGKLTPAANVWSLGMTVAEALAGRTPVWNSSTKGDPVPSESLQQPFLDIVRGSLRRDPAQRCSIAEIKTLLERAAPPPPPLTIVEEPETGQDDPEQREAGRPRIVKAVAAEPVPAAREQSPRAADSTEQVAYPFGKVEPVEPARMSRLFADMEEEDERRIRVAPILFGIVILLAVVAGYLVMHGYRIKLWRPAETQSAPAASQPAPQPQASVVPAPESQPAATTGQPAAPETQSAATAPSEGQTATTAGQAGGTPSQKQADTQTTPGSSQPEQQAQSASAAAGAPAGKAKTGKAEEEPEPSAETLPAANAEGAVLKRVLPDVAPGASESMRKPVQVEVQVRVNEDGSVSNAYYLTQGPGNYYARISRQAALAWKFRAPRRAGHATPSVWTLRFYFERRKTDVTATEDR